MASASRRPTDIVIFGASGALTRRKILPAIGEGAGRWITSGDEAGTQ